MLTSHLFLKEIQDLIHSNGWENELVVESLDRGSSSEKEGQRVRIKLRSDHPVSPSEIVNDYELGIHSLEQIQQECLRSIRTGHPGI